MGGHNKITNKTSLNNILYVRGESRIDFCRQSHNEGGGGGGITNDVLKFRKIIEFQSSWIVNELCTRTLKVPSSCPPIAHIRRWTAWKIILLRSLAPKCSTSDKKKQKRKYKNAKTEKTHTHTQGTRQRKLEISSYKMQL